MECQKKISEKSIIDNDDYMGRVNDTINVVVSTNGSRSKE